MDFSVGVMNLGMKMDISQDGCNCQVYTIAKENQGWIVSFNPQIFGLLYLVEFHGVHAFGMKRSRHETAKYVRYSSTKDFLCEIEQYTPLMPVVISNSSLAQLGSYLDVVCSHSTVTIQQ